MASRIPRPALTREELRAELPNLEDITSDFYEFWNTPRYESPEFDRSKWKGAATYPGYYQNAPEETPDIVVNHFSDVDTQPARDNALRLSRITPSGVDGGVLAMYSRKKLINPALLLTVRFPDSLDNLVHLGFENVSGARLSLIDFMAYPNGSLNAHYNDDIKQEEVEILPAGSIFGNVYTLAITIDPYSVKFYYSDPGKFFVPIRSLNLGHEVYDPRTTALRVLLETGVSQNVYVGTICAESRFLLKKVPPKVLWSNQSIDTAGANSDPVYVGGCERKTFWIISDVEGTLNMQAYDEVAKDYKTFDSISVPKNTLTPYMTTLGARYMRLNFVPTALATVSAWVFLEGIE